MVRRPAPLVTAAEHSEPRGGTATAVGTSATVGVSLLDGKRLASIVKRTWRSLDGP